jgi:DNA anti-recombination protein RmuC
MMNFEEIEKEIKIINDEMGDVKDEMGKIKTHIAEIKVDLDWLKRFFFIVATASVASLVAQLIKF